MARNMSTVAVRQMSSETGQRRFHRVVARMQDKAAAAVDRAAIAHDEVARLRRQADRLLLVHDAELHEQIGKQHLLGLVDDQAHGAFLAMGADIDHERVKRSSFMPGMAIEELVVEKAARGLHLFPPQEVHAGNVTLFGQARKDGFRLVVIVAASFRPATHLKIADKRKPTGDLFSRKGEETDTLPYRQTPFRMVNKWLGGSDVIPACMRVRRLCLVLGAPRRRWPPKRSARRC